MSARDPGGAVRLRPAAARFRSSEGGIVAVEAFSRGDAFDRAWMGWGALRVLSRQDWAPGAVRDEGRVANMDRLLLVLDGALGADCGAPGRRRVGAGDALWLRCGHGMDVRLANASAARPLRLLECWLQPERVNAAPALEVLSTACAGPEATPAGTWRTLLPAGAVGATGATGASVAIATLDAEAGLAVPSDRGGRCWLEVVDGDVIAGDLGRLAPGDGLAWRAGAGGAPGRLVATGAGPARVLRVALAE